MNTVNMLSPETGRLELQRVPQRSSLLTEENSTAAAGGAAGSAFAAQLGEALRAVNQEQQAAQQAAADFVAGDVGNLHQLLIKTERAQLSLQLTVQLTSRVIAAYQEIARMQV